MKVYITRSRIIKNNRLINDTITAFTSLEKSHAEYDRLVAEAKAKYPDWEEPEHDEYDFMCIATTKYYVNMCNIWCQELVTED